MFFNWVSSNVSFKTNLCIIFSMKPTTMFHLSLYLLWEITEATVTIMCKGNFHVKHIALLAYNYTIHITVGIITIKSSSIWRDMSVVSILAKGHQSMGTHDLNRHRMLFEVSGGWLLLIFGLVTTVFNFVERIIRAWWKINLNIIPKNV